MTLKQLLEALNPEAVHPSTLEHTESAGTYLFLGWNLMWRRMVDAVKHNLMQWSPFWGTLFPSIWKLLLIAELEDKVCKEPVST